MNVVYFSEELANRAPGHIYPLCEEPSGAWVSLVDVVEAIRRREPVTIRPATEGEMRRAEAATALYEIGLLLSEKLNTLLDQQSPKVFAGAMTALRDAMESEPILPSVLLDRIA